ncbi:UNVERIFIED_CONTAM: hypothetical protein PYX00_008652 [Menopon gallinae]|uniref:Very-long-chain (3R)-3-hydroxyacyl-CoA dehydratase n=1 Tax=Menopon gallinae TaxID=328185 RepID=A0AAW2HQB4_9NEOP
MTETLSPFVFWAQTESSLSLKVDLKDVKNTNVSLEKDSLVFSADGKGARGQNKYSFTLNFFSTLDPEASTLKSLDRELEFNLKKIDTGFWPRLTKTPQKPAWLKIDFDKWKSEDPDIDEEEGRNVMDDYPGLYDKLQKEERGYRIEDYKKVYLVFYNLFQFIGFVYVLTVIGIRYFRSGPLSMEGTYENTGTVMKLCHLFMWLEVLHPIFGYTKNTVLAPLMQVFGRCTILFVMVEAEPRMQTKPVIFYLFIIWSLVEVVRYPYYIAQLNKIEIGFLTWLRYTIWIPLYPLGILCEGIIILRNIPYFEETMKFTVSLPNSWNFAFHFPTVMKTYLLLLFFPAMCMMMSHMYKDRVRKLGPKKWQKHK